MSDIRDLVGNYDDLYKDLAVNISDLRNVEEVDACGMDSFFEKKASIIKENRMIISSMSQIQDFFRVSKDTLVHKAEKDLWRLSEKDGEIVIERLFDPEGKPLRV